jgi:AcrR family transcriptional regulator
MAKQLSQSDIDDFKARLCAAAERRFAEGGVESVSMRQLAADLGCSPMTPYRYFQDKDDILAAVRTAAFDRFAAALEAAGAGVEDPAERARATGRAYLTFAFSEPNAYRLMFDLSQPEDGRYPELARASERARATMGMGLAGMAERGQVAGDPEVLGYVVWAAIHGLVVLRLAGKLPCPPHGPDFDSLRNEMMRVLLRGMAPAGMPTAT